MSTDKAKRRPQPGSGARIAISASTTIQSAPRTRPSLAPASVFGPTGRRRFWWYTYRYRTCGAYQFGRAKTLDAVTGLRRAGCGHEVSVMIARTYGAAA
jgi:hypothetical protein